MAPPNRPPSHLGSSTNSPRVQKGAKDRLSTPSRGPAGTRINVVGSNAHTPEEMFRLMDNNRGFHSSPADKKTDALRKLPATIKVDPKYYELLDAEKAGDPSKVRGSIGNAIGKGYETGACIQVIDRHGNQVDISVGLYDGKDDKSLPGATRKQRLLHKHAEPISLRALDKNIAGKVEGGGMIVTVDIEPCSHCRPKLEAFAKRKGLRWIDVYVRERASASASGKKASNKTTARTIAKINRNSQGTVLKPKIKRLPRIKIPGKLPPSGGLPNTGVLFPRSGPSTAVKGTLAGLGAAVVLFASREAFASVLPSLRVPGKDPRSIGNYLADPKTKEGIRILDLWDRDLRRFKLQLVQFHIRLRNTAWEEVYGMALSAATSDVQTEHLELVMEQLDIYARNLYVIRDNLEAASKLEAEALDAAKAAKELVDWIDSQVGGWIAFMEAGFDPRQVKEMRQGLFTFAWKTEELFRKLRELELKDTVLLMIDQIDDLATAFNKYYWKLTGEKLRPILEKIGK